MIDPVKKYYLSRTALGLPLGWFGLTIAPGVITWWHGNAIYFVYLMLIFTVIVIWKVLFLGIRGVSLASFILGAGFFLSWDVRNS